MYKMNCQYSNRPQDQTWGQFNSGTGIDSLKTNELELRNFELEFRNFELELRKFPTKNKI